MRRKPPSDSTYNKRRRKRPNKWLHIDNGATTAKTTTNVGGILGRSPLDTTARNELYVMGQDTGQIGQSHLGSSQHINLQQVQDFNLQQVQDFMSGTGFFEQPDIGRNK